MQYRINFFNAHQNGDIFYARTIILPLIKRGFVINFFHQKSMGLLSDIPNCFEYHLSQLSTNYAIDTWMGQRGQYGTSPQSLLDKNRCSFGAHKKLATEILNRLSITDFSEEDLLPEIFFENLEDKDRIDQIVSISENKKMILICNGQVQSDQSDNSIDFNQLIIKLSETHKNCIFLLTSDIQTHKENVIFIGDYTKKLPDLLLIGYLSTFCDIIVGRASGPHCFTHIKQNLMNENKTYISFTHKEHEGKWYCRSKAKQIWSNSTDTNMLEKLISDEILNKLSQ